MKRGIKGRWKFLQELHSGNGWKHPMSPCYSQACTAKFCHIHALFCLSLLKTFLWKALHVDSIFKKAFSNRPPPTHNWNLLCVGNGSFSVKGKMSTLDPCLPGENSGKKKQIQNRGRAHYCWLIIPWVSIPHFIGSFQKIWKGLDFLQG